MQRQLHDLRVGILAAGLMLLLAATAAAQPASGPIVSGAVSAAVTNGNSNMALSGSVGYRMNRGFGFGMELAWIPSRPTIESFRTPRCSRAASTPSSLCSRRTSARSADHDEAVAAVRGRRCR
jgi:hypothetical protein